VGDERLLRYAALFFVVGSVVHNADHFRRGTDSVTTWLLGAGYLGMGVSAVAVAAVLFGHRLAPIVATGAGFALATGFTAAHWLPTWSVFSDSFVEGGASPFSQAASLLEIAGALTIGLAGMRILISAPRSSEARSRAG
jgi:hypothetical protein